MANKVVSVKKTNDPTNKNIININIGGDVVKTKTRK